MILLINIFMLYSILIYLLFNVLRTQTIASLNVAASNMQKINTTKSSKHAKCCASTKAQARRKSPAISLKNSSLSIGNQDVLKSNCT